MIKLMILAPRRQEITHSEFRRYVTEVHGPLVKSVEEVAADIRRYHYNFPLHGDVSWSVRARENRPNDDPSHHSMH